MQCCRSGVITSAPLQSDHTNMLILPLFHQQSIQQTTSRISERKNEAKGQANVNMVLTPLSECYGVRDPPISSAWVLRLFINRP